MFSFIVKRIARHSIGDSLCAPLPFSSKTLHERDLTPSRILPVVTRLRPLSTGPALIAINLPALDTSGGTVPAFATLPESRSASLSMIEKPQDQHLMSLKALENMV